MPYIQEVLTKLKKKLPTYDPETLAKAEAARRRNFQAQSNCRLDCPECGGSGFVKDDAGKLHNCPNVDLFTLYDSERFGIHQSERAADWGDLEDVNEATSQAAEAVKSTMERGSGWVYVWGDYGVGKTLILKTAVAVALRSHKLGAYVRMVDILDDLRAGFNTEDPSMQSQARLEWYRTIPVLAIDEFDRVKNTEWATEKRFSLMDARYQQGIRGETITLLASNTDPARLEGYLFDRARDNRFTIVKVTGESYRLGAQWGNQ